MIPATLLEAYSAAIVTDLQGHPLAGSTSLPFPLFIITAHNPYSFPTPSINKRLHQCLVHHVACNFPEAQWEEVIGQSKDGQWKETSLAISGLSEDEAIAIGRHFAQWAIFKLDGEGLLVMACA